MTVDRRRVASTVAIASALLAVGITWACGIGRYGGPDEPAHVLRAYAVAHGDLTGDPVASLPSGYRAVTVPRSLGTGDPTCYRHDPTLTSACSVADGRDGTMVVATSAGVAPPLWYAMVGLPVRLVGAADDPLAYRLAALGWMVATLVVAGARARPLGERAWAFVVVVPPAAWFLLGVVTTNGLEVALAVLAWVGVARTRRGDTSVHDLWWIGVPLGLAVAMRPIAVAAVGAVAVVLVVSGSMRSWRTATPVVAPTAVAGVSLLVWQRIVAWDGTDPRTATDVGVWRALRDAVGGLPRTAGELVGTSGWLELSQPVVVKVAWVALLAACVATSRRASRTVWTSRMWAIAVWAGALVLTPVVFETVAASSIGPIWQGRYSLAVWFGAAAVLAVGVRRPALVLALVGVVEAAAYVVTVRRYAVGTNGSWWLTHAADSTRWLGPRAWVVVHLVLVLVLALVATGLVARRTPQST